MLWPSLSRVREWCAGFAQSLLILLTVVAIVPPFVALIALTVGGAPGAAPALFRRLGPLLAALGKGVALALMYRFLSRLSPRPDAGAEPFKGIVASMGCALVSSLHMGPLNPAAEVLPGLGTAYTTAVATFTAFYLASMTVYVALCFIPPEVLHRVPMPLPPPPAPSPPRPSPRNAPPSTSRKERGGMRSFRNDLEKLLAKPVRGLEQVPAVERLSGPYLLPDHVAELVEGVDLRGASCYLVGCGGWGCVYECITAKGLRVALKVAKGFRDAIEKGSLEEITAPESVLRRVRAEAELARKLTHPNLMKLLGYSLSLPMLVYEYAGGGSLRRHLELIRGRLTSILLVGVQAADALRYLHSRGLVHQDVKPGNMLVKEGVIKVGDYSSLRRILEMLTSSSTASRTCTYGYCAPEQIYADLAEKAGERGLENRVDVYQLGSTILEMIVGLPLDGQIAVSRPQEREKLLRKVENRELRLLLSQMLSVNPEDRPSMDEVVRRLAEIYWAEGGH